MKVGEFRRRQAAAMLEAELQDQVVALAKTLGWRCYHTFDSRRSELGFPDMCLVSARRARVMFRELKKQDGRLTVAQRGWLADLGAAGQDVGVWRPVDLLTGVIERELRGNG